MLEGERIPGGPCENFERSEILLREFRRRTGGPYVLCENESGTTDGELGGVQTGFVGLGLVDFLSVSQSLTEVLVHLGDVRRKITGVRRRDILFEIYTEIRFVAFVGEKRSNPGGSGHSAVEGELGETEPVRATSGGLRRERLSRGTLDRGEPKLNIFGAP